MKHTKTFRCMQKYLTLTRRICHHRNPKPYSADKQQPRREGVKMTQKSNQFKGQQKKKSVPPSRHGKATRIRKGKRNVKPSKVTADMETDRVRPLFINLFLHYLVGCLGQSLELVSIVSLMMLGWLQSSRWYFIDTLAACFLQARKIYVDFSLTNRSCFTPISTC